MPGIYGSKQFVVGAPSTPKPVDSGTCMKCGRESFRQRFVPEKGWVWLCQSFTCDPAQGRIERHRTRQGATQVYVPSNYAEGERSTAFDSSMGAAIRRSRGERS